MRVLDICSGECGWSRVFTARGHDCVCIDLKPPALLPDGCSWWERDLFTLDEDFAAGFDFGVASTPCEQFAMWGMKHFHPNPPWPSEGIRMFSHVRDILRGIPHVMENVRAAEQFMGTPVGRCGPFSLWGNAVPILLPMGITKSKWKPKSGRPGNWSETFMGTKSVRKALSATIPLELASCVVDYAEWTIQNNPTCPNLDGLTTVGSSGPK